MSERDSNRYLNLNFWANEELWKPLTDEESMRCKRQKEKQRTFQEEENDKSAQDNC